MDLSIYILGYLLELLIKIWRNEIREKHFSTSGKCGPIFSWKILSIGRRNHIFFSSEVGKIYLSWWEMWWVLEKFSKKKVPLTMLLLRTFSLTKWRIWQRIFATKKSTQIGVRSQAMVWGHSTYIAEKRRKRKQHESPLVFTSNKQTNATPEISKYSSVGSDSTLTKWIIFILFFKKWKWIRFNFFLKLYFFPSYTINIVIWVVKLFRM
jgi:hypothetical protein